MITSAYFLDGRTKSSKAGLTNFAYCTSNIFCNVSVTMSSHVLKMTNLQKAHSQNFREAHNQKFPK